MNKQIDVVPEETMARFVVILGREHTRAPKLDRTSRDNDAGNVLQIQVSDLQQSNRSCRPMAGTLEDVERQRILQALRKPARSSGTAMARQSGWASSALLCCLKCKNLASHGIANYSPLTQERGI
jgi:hypothetical protein